MGTTKVNSDIMVTKLSIEDKMIDGKRINTFNQSNYLIEGDDGKFIFVCSECVGQTIGGKNEVIDIDLYTHTDKGISMVPTYTAKYTGKELQKMKEGDKISFKSLFRDHPRINNNYNEIMAYCKKQNYNIIKG